MSDKDSDTEEQAKKSWEIVGPFGPGEMPPELQKQWEEFQRTGVTPETWTEPPEDF